MQSPKKVSQDYFDSIVSENVNDFGMNEDEAIQDAINQLKSQGCDIGNICKYGQTEQKELTNAVKTLHETFDRLFKEENADEQQKLEINAVEQLKIMKKKFEKDLSFRVLASKIAEPELNAYKVLLQYLEKIKPNTLTRKESIELLENFLITLQAYLFQQSDIIDNHGLDCLKILTDETNYINTSVINLLLKCLSTCCRLNESNRQHLVENGVCENLMEIFHKHKTNDDVLCEACLFIRNLLLDDDMRVEFSNAHENAKYIASKLNGLDTLLNIGLDNQNTLNEETLANIMLTLSKLAVRNEFCQEICDKGGLNFVLGCLHEKHLKNVALLKSALSLLKSVCNNDQVRYEATKSDAISLLKDILIKYNANNQISELVCAALSTLMLRNVEASERFYALQVHPLLIQLLNIHNSKPKLIRQCCLALRNSISRNKALGEKLIELRAEDILRKILDQKDPQCYDEVKSVLRDLGCHIELKELWTGTGKNLVN